MQVEINSISVPVLVTPRINGIAVTVTQIKTIYSAYFVDPTSTPLSFWLEYRDAVGTDLVTTIEYDPAKSSDSQLFFPIPDALYQNENKYSVLFFWLVQDNATPTPNNLEKIYTEQALVLEVVDLHNTV